MFVLCAGREATYLQKILNIYCAFVGMNNKLHKKMHGTQEIYIYSLKKRSAYTNDILITTATKQSVIYTFQKLKIQLIHFELIVNVKKLNI